MDTSSQLFLQIFEKTLILSFQQVFHIVFHNIIKVGANRPYLFFTPPQAFLLPLRQVPERGADAPLCTVLPVA